MLPSLIRGTGEFSSLPVTEGIPLNPPLIKGEVGMKFLFSLYVSAIAPLGGV
jgi:hypothetical protein